MNLAGVLVLFAGAVLLVIGLRGTQAAALPSLFPPASASSTSASAAPGTPTITPPGGGPPIPIVAD